MDFMYILNTVLFVANVGLSVYNREISGVLGWGLALLWMNTAYFG